MIKIKDLHFERAADWLLHTMAVAKELEESLNVGHRRIRRAAQGHNLPEEDAEWPDIRLAGVNALEQSFWRHPLDGKAAVCRLAVVFVHVHVASQPKVGNLEDTIFADQHVPSRQISMNALHKERKNVTLDNAEPHNDWWYLFRFEIIHTTSNLVGERDEIFVRKRVLTHPPAVGELDRVFVRSIAELPY